MHCSGCGGGALHAAIARVLRHALSSAGTSKATRSARLSRALSGTLAAVSATVGARGATKLAEPPRNPTKRHAFSTSRTPCAWPPVQYPRPMRARRLAHAFGGSVGMMLHAPRPIAARNRNASAFSVSALSGRSWRPLLAIPAPVRCEACCPMCACQWLHAIRTRSAPHAGRRAAVQRPRTSWLSGGANARSFQYAVAGDPHCQTGMFPDIGNQHNCDYTAAQGGTCYCAPERPWNVHTPA